MRICRLAGQVPARRRRRTSSMRRSRSSAAVVVASLLVLAVSGCSDDSSERDARAHEGVPFKETVVITSSGYHPRRAEILVGGSITWINKDPTEAHTAETPPGRHRHTTNGEKVSFDTHTLSWGEPYTVTFHKPGTYSYESSFDFGMEGVVEVAERKPPR